MDTMECSLKAVERRVHVASHRMWRRRTLMQEAKCIREMRGWRLFLPVPYIREERKGEELAG
eukprot:4794033-Prorocentrum_lima.AAC.1